MNDRLKTKPDEYTDGYNAYWEDQDSENPFAKKAEAWKDGFNSGTVADDGDEFEDEWNEGVKDKAQKRSLGDNPYQENADDWQEGFDDAQSEDDELDPSETRPGQMAQLTGRGAFRCDKAHECPRCGTHIPEGWWLEPLDYHDGEATFHETIVCSAHCKARESCWIATVDVR